MKFTYKKILFRNTNKYYHLCVLETDDKIKFNNLQYVYKVSYNKYVFDLQYGLFDNLSNVGIEYLDNINKLISESNFGVSYINSDLWKQHKLYESMIEETKYNNTLFYEPRLYPVFTGEDIILDEDDIIDKTTIYKNKNYNNESKTFKIQTLDIDKKVLTKIYKNANSKTTILSFAKSSDDLKNIYNLINNIQKYNKEKEYLIELWECSFNVESEIDIINIYLNIIFSMENTYNLIKCDNCKKYFICKPGKTKRCDRIYIDTFTCRELKDKIRRKYNDEPLKKLEKSISDMVGKQLSIYGKDEEYNRFHDNKTKMKEKYYNNQREYYIWLLSFYKSKKRIEEKIEKFNLSIYNISISDFPNIK